MASLVVLAYVLIATQIVGIIWAVVRYRRAVARRREEEAERAFARYLEAECLKAENRVIWRGLSQEQREGLREEFRRFGIPDQYPWD